MGAHGNPEGWGCTRKLVRVRSRHKHSWGAHCPPDTGASMGEAPWRCYRASLPAGKGGKRNAGEHVSGLRGTRGSNFGAQGTGTVIFRGGHGLVCSRMGSNRPRGAGKLGTLWWGVGLGGGPGAKNLVRARSLDFVLIAVGTHQGDLGRRVPGTPFKQVTPHGTLLRCMSGLPRAVGGQCPHRP